MDGDGTSVASYICTEGKDTEEKKCNKRQCPSKLSLPKHMFFMRPNVFFLFFKNGPSGRSAQHVQYLVDLAI